MDTIFVNSENDPYRLLLDLSDQINTKRSEKYVAFLYLSIYDTWKNMKMPYKNNKFKVSHPTLNEEFKSPSGSYSSSDVQDYYEYIFKNMRQMLIILQ